MPDIRSFRTPLPPLTGQDQIIRELDQITTRFRTAIAKITTSIERLREYRVALITAAVAGQIDVQKPIHAVVSNINRGRVRTLVGAEIVYRHQSNPRFGRVKHQKLLYLREAHVGIGELEGHYLRVAAGPHDPALISETERGMETAGFYREPAVERDGIVTVYAPLANAGSHRAELASVLGARTDGLGHLIDLFRELDTRATEGNYIVDSSKQ